MTKMPTTRAITANTRKNVVKNDSDCLMSLCVSSVISVPVTTSTPEASAAWSVSSIESATCCWETPSSAATEIDEKRPSSPTQLHGGRLGPHDVRGPAGAVGGAEPGDADELEAVDPSAGDCTVTVSPTW